MPISPTPQTYTETLTQAGLTPEQAQIYEILLKNGPSSARKVVQNSPLKRSLVYKILDDLGKIGLVERDDKIGKISIFTPAHPLKLKELVEKQEAKAKTAQVALDGLMGSLTSDFNLISGRPGVKLYEGRDGIAGALKHIAANFKPDTEIISFVKVLTDKFGDETKGIFDEYIKKRVAGNIKTRVIAIDTPEGQELKRNDNKSLRETRLVNAKNLPLDFPGGEILIYGNEICAITIENQVYFAFSVESRAISQMLRAFFQTQWELLPANV